ncbi:MAG: DDE-type integrase/transposase/recombinase [Candidatus Obscuribacterales bacterium]|nr:DDE-type integrase/transposase/recombinase [Candidatus Obscuribacterales bacterium]
MPLATQATVTRNEADSAAKKLGISPRAVYKLIARSRNGDGLLTDLAPRVSSGGKGKPRLKDEIEKIISDVIESFYLSRQRRSIAVIVREIRMRCVRLGYHAPSRNTVEARIRNLDPTRVTASREGYRATKRLSPVTGETPPPVAPLALVQIDHSPVDVIVVDERSREPIGRPSLTLAIDVFTRCIVGMLLSLEAPSATSVGLCLAHTVCNKQAYLLRLGLEEIEWQMHGKPEVIHLDNAPEFHSEALQRGCDQHGITQDFRPKMQPHFGGIIERVIGTAMKMSHELPGTTFSNIQERGNYDSEAKAVLTLQELEKWLVLAVASYHKSMHSTLKMPPASFWNRNVQPEKIISVRNEKAFLIDFLPVIKRSVGRTGFVIDHITYYADSLKPWIASRDRLDKFIIRRDPRDLSRVWVLDPPSNQYIELPYRSISNPSVTLWEHRKAVARLRDLGRAEIDETSIFRMIEKMRLIVSTAEKESKRTRRENARRGHLFQKEPQELVPPNNRQRRAQAKRFDDIEEW